MATKKVEEKDKKKKVNKKAVSSENKNKDVKKKKTTKSANTKKKVKEVKEEVKELDELDVELDEVEEKLILKEEKKEVVVVDDDDDEEEDDDEDDDEEYVSKKSESKKEIKVEKKLKEEKTKKKRRAGEDSFFEQNAEIVNLVKILLGLLVVIGLVYVIVAAINGDFKKKDKDEEDSIAEIQNDKILASSTFTRTDKEYLVLFFDSTSKWGEYYKMIFEDYTSQSEKDMLPLYYVDLSEKSNKYALAEKESNEDVQDYKDLKVTIPTLIKIKDGRNVDYFEGEDAVNELKEAIKK